MLALFLMKYIRADSKIVVDTHNIINTILPSHGNIKGKYFMYFLINNKKAEPYEYVILRTTSLQL